ncbi:MAG: HlyC/CorC family transporter [Bacilli bacterium]|nr:HlyC/CorC family transporter [Bacilli bacterium]
MNWYDYLYISALVILLVLSGFFSASDMAYSSVNILRLEHRSRNGDKKAKKVLKHVKDYDHTIASILFSNDFVNILASSLASLLGRDILTQYVGVEFASMISSVTFFFLVLIIGEITPKAFAKTHSYSLAIHLRNFVTVLRTLTFPFVYPTSKLSDLLTRPIFAKAPKEDTISSDEELEAMVDQIEESGLIDEDEGDLIRDAIAFIDQSCYEIMTPRVKIYGYNINTSFKDFLKKKDAFRHSRLIVYKGDMDHIIGYIQIKTLLRYLVKRASFDVNDLILPIVSVPRTLEISSALTMMKATKTHIAVVRDEFGGTDGIITMEDILEELVGEMWDESEAVSPDIIETERRNLFKIKGKMPIDDFFARFELDDDEIDKDYSTVSGWVNDKLGRFARIGDKFTYENLEITVTKLSKYSNEEILVRKKRKKKKK